jgi:16S rRNA (cytosine967-C5)-methyltransferase
MLKPGTKVTAREIALKALFKIEQEGSFAEETTEELCFRAELSAADRRLAAELALGTTKMRKRIDYELDSLVAEGLEKLTPWIRNVLRLGIYQLEFTERIPAYAAVNESVNLARKFGHAGVAKLVNAVLRNYQRKKEEIKFPEDELDYLATFYSFPEWLIERWLKYFGRESVEKLCEYFNRKPDFGFRINTLKCSKDEVEKYLQGKNIAFRPGGYCDDYYYPEGPVDLEELELLQAGKIYIQDESSLLAVKLLDPQPGETVLDLCAAPGGKSTYTASKMQNKGRIIGVDKTAEKLKRLEENCQRLGVRIVEFEQADGLTFKTEQVDRILVDAPCSGSGVLNRNADARWQKKEEDLKRLAELQLALLENAVKMLKPKGVLVYSTCSILSEENQSVIEKFLDQHSELRVADAGKYVSSALATKGGYLRTLPFLHNMDGAFAVRLEKR